MESKYKIGQKVIIKKLKTQSSDVRDSGISQYANQTGIVTNCYFIRPNWGNVFYIYTVKIGDGHKDIVFHEDEVKS